MGAVSVSSAMTISSLLDWGTRVLQEAGLPTPRLDAEVMLASISGHDRTYLLTWSDRVVPPSHLEAFHASVRRRALREPVSYITGRREFFDVILGVSPAVLIPRAETELLVGRALAWVQEHRDGRAQILDLGSGSGAIAIALAKNLPQSHLVATDVSEEALAVARDNLARHSLQARVQLRHGDLYQAVAENERFDIIVSNPPYVSEAEFSELQSNVRDYEPRRALVSGVSGLEIIDRICERARFHLVEGGAIGIEIGCHQGAKARRLLSSAGFRNVEVVPDLAGLDRMVWGEME